MSTKEREYGKKKKKKTTSKKWQMNFEIHCEQQLTRGIFFNFSDSSFCICKAFLAFAKASRERLLLFPAVEDVPSVLDFPGTS